MILLTFCGNDLEQLRYFKCVLLGFEAVCGLKINLAKSELLPEVEELAQILRCKVSNLPMRFALGSKFKSKAIWDFLLQKVERKLFG